MNKAAFLVFTLLFSFQSYAGTVVTYSNLRKSKIGKSLIYLNQVQKIIKEGSDIRMNDAVAFKESTGFCGAKKQWTCHPGLYGFNRCVKNKELAIFSCPRPLNQKMISPYFAEPEFHRASWTSLLIKLTSTCDKKYTNACKELLKLKGQFLKAK